MTTKYIVLAGEDYYPTGCSDARYACDTFADASLKAVDLIAREESCLDWAEVLDVETLDIVYVAALSYNKVEQSRVVRCAKSWEEYHDN